MKECQSETQAEETSHCKGRAFLLFRKEGLGRDGEPRERKPGRRHKPLKVPLKLAGHKSVVEITAYRLLQAVGGAFLLWSLPETYAVGVRGSNLSCSQWYQSWWPWWEKSLTALGVQPELHLRRSGFVKRGKLPLTETDHQGPRFLPVPCLSTLALLHCLSRMCTPSRGLQGEVTRSDRRLDAGAHNHNPTIPHLAWASGSVCLLRPSVTVRPGPQQGKMVSDFELLTTPLISLQWRLVTRLL